MKSITEEVLGNSAPVRVLDYLIDGREFDYSIRDISEETNITRQHVYKVVNALMKYGIIKKTRLLSGIQLYKIDKDNIITKGLIEFNKALIRYQEGKVLNNPYM
jgi:predicted transcriptional regulator